MEYGVNVEAAQHVVQHFFSQLKFIDTAPNLLHMLFNTYNIRMCRYCSLSVKDEKIAQISLFSLT